MKLFRNRQFGSQLNKFFDKIYCINLDSRPDRWRYVNDHFKRLNLNRSVERFSAVDVRNNPEFVQHERLLKKNFSLLAMCGCMLSHRKIVENAKQMGLKNVLVFEDDIQVLEGNTGNIRNSLADLKKIDWDVFYLGATYLFPLKRVGSNLVNAYKGAYATHAIAYNSSIFDQILDLLTSESLEFLQSDRFEVNAVDKWLQSDLFDHSKFYGANPIMVVQGLQESDIASNQQDGIAQTQIDLFSKNLEC